MTPLRAFLDLLFPPRCLGCEKRGAYYCLLCRTASRAVPDPFCASCSRTVSAASSACGCSHPALLYTVAVGEYEGNLRRAVLQLKFHGRTAGAPALAALLYLRLNTLPLSEYLLIPVPLHPSRERERGYNQSTLLARELARLSGAEMAQKALRRVRNTQAQSKLDGPGRQRNMRDAFSGSPVCLGRTIILIDDVCTTGATMRAAATAARAAGATSVYGAVLAATMR